MGSVIVGFFLLELPQVIRCRILFLHVLQILLRFRPDGGGCILLGFPKRLEALLAMHPSLGLGTLPVSGLLGLSIKHFSDGCGVLSPSELHLLDALLGVFDELVEVQLGLSLLGCRRPVFTFRVRARLLSADFIQLL